MGTVRTLSATSAEESFEQLQNCISQALSYGIIVPQAHFLEQFLRFYPEFPRERLYTPSSLLKACGLKSVPSEIALLSEHFDEFADPSFLEFKDETFETWLKQQSYAFWNFDLEVKVPFERCILFASFSKKQQQYLASALKCRELFILQRTFSQNTSAHELNNVYLYPHRNVADGYAWVERMKTEHPNACGILLQTAEPLTTLFRKPSPKRALAWTDWQDEGTVGSFLAHAQMTVELETLQTWQKDCDEAFRECLTENFNVLREHLLQSGKTWIEPFVRCDFPASASVGDYITLLQNAKPPSEFTNLSILQTCPSVVTKRAFFSYLRRFLQYRSGLEANVLRWDEVLFLPIKEGFVPQAVSTGGETDANVSAWMNEVVSRGGLLHLGVPLRDRNGEPLKPLLNTENLQNTVPSEIATADDRTYITVSNALSVATGAYEQRSKSNILRFPKDIRKSKTNPFPLQSDPHTKSALHIPKELIRFSCKNWERFYLCPRKIWLEKILKTTSIPLSPTASKALFVGESIHDNLTFIRQPLDLNEWRESIQQRSDVRWEKLRRYHSNFSFLWQRHQRALEYSLTMAAACEDLLHDDWRLYSEYVLPKESLYTGRIDLLAVHEGKQKIAVIDYKSGFNENFTQKKLQSGHGWQLLLYGRAMQALYPTYEVELRMILRTGEVKLLHLDEVNDAVSEMNAWISDFQQSGLYEALPDEKAETLPLAFVGGKTRRY